jgi:hypothetical protein
MVLAGFDGTSAPDNAPERHFAAVWDRFARRERRRWSQSPWLSRSSRREDVQTLLRTANAVLAARMTCAIVALASPTRRRIGTRRRHDRTPGLQRPCPSAHHRAGGDEDRFATRSLPGWG